MAGPLLRLFGVRDVVVGSQGQSLDTGDYLQFRAGFVQQWQGVPFSEQVQASDDLENSLGAYGPDPNNLAKVAGQREATYELGGPFPKPSKWGPYSAWDYNEAAGLTGQQYAQQPGSVPESPTRPPGAPALQQPPFGVSPPAPGQAPQPSRWGWPLLAAIKRLFGG